MYYHKLSFTNRNYSTNTSLSTYIWHLKNKHLTRHHLGNVKATIRQSQDIKMTSLPPQETRNYHSPITKHPAKKKSESISKCRHESKKYCHISTHTHNPSTIPILLIIPKTPPQITPQHTDAPYVPHSSIK